MKKNCCFHLILLLLIFLAGEQNIFSQIIIDEPPKMRYYEMTTRVKKFKDMKNMRDVLHKDRWLMGRNRIIGNFSYTTGRVQIDDGHELHSETRSALGFFTRIRFLEEFSFNSTFYKEFNPKAIAPWIADYTYSIGRYNWRPHRFNYGYENYVNN